MLLDYGHITQWCLPRGERRYGVLLLSKIAAATRYFDSKLAGREILPRKAGDWGARREDIRARAGTFILYAITSFTPYDSPPYFASCYYASDIIL